MSPTQTPEALLIHISGQDSPGITAACTAILAQHNATILDIGQAVVHQTLALGILAAAPPDTDLQPLESALQARAASLGLHARFTRVHPAAIGNQPSATHPGHYIVTLLARSLTAAHLAAVSSVIAAHAMNVDRIDRLSDRMSDRLSDRLSGPHSLADSATNACLELAISGDPAREPSLRAAFLATAQQLCIDIACQREGLFRRNRRLFAFDMDSTLIQGEVIDELAHLAGVGQQVSQITAAAMRGELDFDQSFTRRVALLKGLPAESVYALLGSIPLADGAERLFRTLKLLGYKTAILSGGFNFFARSLQARFGIDYVYSNELEIVDGCVTGRVIPPIINGARKAELLKQIATTENISIEQTVAVGDGANDIPMLTLAGMGIAYRAKPLVCQSADQSIANLGLDGLLYLVGVRDHDLLPHEPTG